jgi:hypothetical protein
VCVCNRGCAWLGLGVSIMFVVEIFHTWGARLWLQVSLLYVDTHTHTGETSDVRVSYFQW